MFLTCLWKNSYIYCLQILASFLFFISTERYCYLSTTYFLTLNRLTRNKAMRPLVILCSPTEDSKLKSISGMDVNPIHNWSEGGGFICNRTVPRRDATLIAKEMGTFNKKKISESLKTTKAFAVRNLSCWLN